MACGCGVPHGSEHEQHGRGWRKKHSNGSSHTSWEWYTLEEVGYNMHHRATLTLVDGGFGQVTQGGRLDHVADGKAFNGLVLQK